MMLFSLEAWSAQQVSELLEAANSLKEEGRQVLPSTGAVGLMFFEDSTRTRLSFERAAHFWGRDCVTVDLAHSSLNKGESVLETFEVLEDYGVTTLVLRSKEALFDWRAYQGGLHVLSAGQGTEYHPTQVLGDALALMRYWKLESVFGLKHKTLLISGDLKHSRVAHSWYQLAKILGLRLKLAAPRVWLPDHWGLELERYESLEEGLEGADAFMALRVQRERHGSDSSGCDEFMERFQCRQEHLKGRPLLHPGPTNWGVELEASLQSYSESLIRSQRIECYRVRTELLRRF